MKFKIRFLSRKRQVLRILSFVVDFVKYGLLYPRILPNHLKTLVPERVPSGSQTLTFEFQKAH